MRIVAGNFRSRRIEAPRSDQTRPTLDKVREAVFNRIGPYFEGGVMLDLFAGSGAVGLEALSRGMERVVFVDRSMEAVDVIRRNIAALGVQQVSSVWKMDWQAALRRCQREALRFDLVYLDPPYQRQPLAEVLIRLEASGLLADNATVIAESLRETVLDEQVGQLTKIREAVYGISRISIYRKESES